MSSRALVLGVLQLLHLGLEEATMVVAPPPSFFLGDLIAVWIQLRQVDVWEMVGVF